MDMVERGELTMIELSRSCRRRVFALGMLFLSALAVAAEAGAQPQGQAQPPLAKADRGEVQEIAVGIEESAPVTADPELTPPRPVLGRPIVLPGATGAFAEHDQTLLV
jgi:hypothetical protein